MANIDYIMSLLSWNNSAVEQKKGIDFAKDVKCINAFLQPGLPYGKDVWENCAKILCERSDEELYPYLWDLLEWLQDLNWPGAFLIMERLISYKGDLLIVCYKKTIERALSYPKDEQEWFDNLTKLIENKTIAEKLRGDNLYLTISERYKSLWC